MTGGGLGPNILLNPNGPFASGNWTPANITETTGQTDPFGGTSASLLTDTATNATHTTSQVYNSGEFAGATYLMTAFVKPGTYTNQIDFQCGAGSSHIIGFDPVGHGVANVGGMVTVAALAVGNGFWKVTGTYVATSPGAGTAVVGFNNAFAAYAGTLQTFTVSGVSLQQVF
jgi:hypothetical protein